VGFSTLTLYISYKGESGYFVGYASDGRSVVSSLDKRYYGVTKTLEKKHNFIKNIKIIL
jgi:hypothetical protein